MQGTCPRNSAFSFASPLYIILCCVHCDVSLGCTCARRLIWVCRCAFQLQAFVERKSGDGQQPITLACGHNSFSEDVGFVGSVIQLFTGIQNSTLQPRKAVLWGMDVWEYVCPTDARASVVVRSLAVREAIGTT